MQTFRRIFLGFGVFIVIIILGALYSFLESRENFAPKFSWLVVGQNQLRVEIVDMPALQVRGLSGRDSLEAGQGMLFVFKDSQIRSFWMKDMKFPLDIVWISDGRVVGFEANVPNPSMGEKPIMVSSPSAVQQVLEINSGGVAELGIKVGDSISLADVAGG